MAEGGLGVPIETSLVRSVEGVLGLWMWITLLLLVLSVAVDTGGL